VPVVVKQLPNLLTFFRLFLIPFFVLSMHGEPTEGTVTVAIVIFVVAALTDLVDGMIARRYSAVSDLGKLLDPLADKILVMAALVMLAAQRSDESGRPWVAGWIVVLVLSRELWVTGLRGMAATRGIVVAANDSGKVKSLLQMVAIVFLLLHDRGFEFGGLVFNGEFVGTQLLLLSLFFSIWGAVEYTLLVLSANKVVGSKPVVVADHHDTPEKDPPVGG
jgi:CDP-diacylglycerol--glycerol-3-phosphate 3-phosphatidyltransferase